MAALPLQSSFIINKLNPQPYKTLSSSSTKPKFTIISQDSSSKPTIEEPQSTKKPISSGQGFGSGSIQLPKSDTNPSAVKKKEKGRRDRGSVIRRIPVEKPAFSDKKRVEKVEQSLSENAFLVAWLILGGVILVEGIALAASGFLPEEWDKLFVKYLYPSFTPTVFLFVAGTVVYGVYKYLQTEGSNQK